MKFGLEVEKFLYDLKRNRPSEGVFRFIDALSDYDYEPDALRQVTNEFVLNMVEIICDPSETPTDVLKQYILNYLMLNSIASRESVAMVSMGSLPMEYQPHMSPKWAYFVQNSILDKKIQTSWMMNKESPLTRAGNCAGIHVHAEIETLPEYLFSTRELMDKFNMGLMMTPLIAFSSSPYFFGEHEASSMRGQKYFNGVYKDFPLNGGLPHVMESSEEVLKFFKFSAEHWIHAGVQVGIPEEDLKKLTAKKGASWNPIRWNRAWNTIELRALDSDRIDYDCAKFIWVCGAMKRTDLKGEALKCIPLTGNAELSSEMIREAFRVENGKVCILPTHAIKDLFSRSIKDGLNDPFVVEYLKRLQEFARPGIDPESGAIFDILKSALNEKQSTSQVMIRNFGDSKTLDNNRAVNLVNYTITDEKEVLKRFINHFPDMVMQWSKLIK